MAWKCKECEFQDRDLMVVSTHQKENHKGVFTTIEFVREEGNAKNSRRDTSRS